MPPARRAGRALPVHRALIARGGASHHRQVVERFGRPVGLEGLEQALDGCLNRDPIRPAVVREKAHMVGGLLTRAIHELATRPAEQDEVLELGRLVGLKVVGAATRSLIAELTLRFSEDLH